MYLKKISRLITTVFNSRLTPRGTITPIELQIGEGICQVARQHVETNRV